MSAPARLCPSHPAEPGASLLGVVNSEGTVSILPRPIPLNAEFLESGGDLERKFRFTGSCVEGKCKQWRNGGCRIGTLVASFEHSAATPGLRPCAIRANCRWFAQEGAAACRGCAYVVTDNR